MNTASTTDVNLVQAVRDLLFSVGLGQETLAFYDTDPIVLQAQDKTPDVQRNLLNRYWNMQLLTSGKITIEERYCLIPNGTIEEWLRLFQVRVLPFLITNRLPMNTK